MIKDWLVSNFEKQRKQIESEAASPDLQSNEEGIHRLRVAIKQVRALFKLVSWLSPKKFSSKEAFFELRPFFKAMGRVRDVQVLEGLLAKYEEESGDWYAGLGFLLDSSRRGASEGLPHAIEAFSPANLAQVQSQMALALADFDDRQLLNKAHAKLQKRFAKIEAGLSIAEEDAKALHDIRTWLKECLYVMEMLNKAVKGEVWPKALVKDLFWVAREAGEWHDREVLLSFLQSLDEAEAPFLQGAAYVALQEKLENEVAERTKKLIERIRGFLKSFAAAPFSP